MKASNDGARIKELVVNGKHYPMWSSFISNKKRFIDGKIFNVDMGMTAEATLKDIRLEPNGDSGAMIVFDIEDKDGKNEWSFDVSIGGISGNNTGIEGLCISCMYVGDFVLQAPQSKSTKLNKLEKQIEQLREQIDYEEAMYQSCVDYPTDTYQFRQALNDNRIRIDKMHERLAELEATPTNKLKEGK